MTSIGSHFGSIKVTCVLLHTDDKRNAAVLHIWFFFCSFSLMHNFIFNHARILLVIPSSIYSIWLYLFLLLFFLCLCLCVCLTFSSSQFSSSIQWSKHRTISRYSSQYWANVSHVCSNLAYRLKYTYILIYT